jgi:hypothetical protein
MLQLEANIESTLQSIKYELGLSITHEPRVPSLANYKKDWKLFLWETCFFREFRSKDGIRHTKLFDQQVGG